MSGVRKLSVEELGTLVADQTGTMAAAMLSHLKEAGHTAVSRKQIRDLVKSSMSEVETGRIVVPHPRKPGRTMVAGWLRVVDVLSALVKSVMFEHASGLISWPSNVPDGEFWIGFAADKGGGATKLIAKFVCSELADSWRHTCMIAMLDRVDDIYNHLSEAWLPVYRQLSDLQQRGASIRLPWQPHLLPNIIRTADGGFGRRVQVRALPPTTTSPFPR